MTAEDGAMDGAFRTVSDDAGFCSGGCIGRKCSRQCETIRWKWSFFCVSGGCSG